MHLSERELDIVKYLEGNGEATAAIIAKATRAKEASIRYASNRLIENGTIKRRVFINTFALGYQRTALFVALASQGQKIRDTFVEALVKHPNVSLILEVGGEFHYELNITTRSTHELTTFLEWLGETFSEIIFKKSITIQIGHRSFGTKFLSAKIFPRQPLFHGPTTEIHGLDELDRNILHAAMGDSWKSHRDLAKAVGISPPSFEVRWKKLQKQQVITGVSYLIEQAEILRYIILVQTKSVSQKVKKALVNFAELHPNIQYFVSNVGSWDFELGVDVPFAEKASVVVQELYEKIGDDLLQLSVIPLFRRHKVMDYPFAN